MHKIHTQKTVQDALPFRRRAGRLVSLILIVLVLLIVDGRNAWSAAAEQTRVKAQFGDWQIVCKRPTGAKNDICALVQDVTSESNPNVGLSVQFQKSPSGTKVLRVFAPLGVLLPHGLGLQIDGAKVGHAKFVRCHVVGCFAQVTLTSDLLDQFSNGKTAWFIVFQTREAGIGIPVSLAGFSAAIAQLN